MTMPNKVIKTVFLGATFVALIGVIRPAFTETKPAITPSVVPHASYLQPVPGLQAGQKQLFRDGEKAFNTLWIAIPEDVISNWWDLSRPGPGGRPAPG